MSITLRPLALEDASAMAVVLSSPDLYTFTGGEPPTVAELERRYAIQTRGHSGDGREEWINAIVMVDDEAVGYVQATVSVDRASAEIAWVIGRRWQGRGFAQQATRLLIGDLAARGVQKVIAHIHPAHVASQRIAVHLGMVATDVIVDGETRWTGAT